MTKQEIALAAGCLLVGGGAGYLIAKFAFGKKYEAAIKEEVSGLREAYRKREEQQKVAAENDEAKGDLNIFVQTEEPAEVVEAVEAIVEDYRPRVEGVPVMEPLDIPKKPVEPNPIKKNVFSHPTPTPEEVADDTETGYNWALAAQESNIYVIPQDEYIEDRQYTKWELVYFEADDTLMDDQENIVPSPYDSLGPDALDMFGVASNDPNIVYVRNENVACDFEVVRKKGSYQEEILGIRPEPRRVGKMRDEDE